jgi:hypothetical protein
LALIGYHPVHQSSLAKLFGPQVSSSISKKWRNPSWIFELGDLEIGKKNKNTQKNILWNVHRTMRNPFFISLKQKKLSIWWFLGWQLALSTLGATAVGFRWKIYQQRLDMTTGSCCRGYQRSHIILWMIPLNLMFFFPLTLPFRK